MHAILHKCRRRSLLTLATGTGKTVIAFQICRKLWNSHWNRTGEYRRLRILYLADRNVLMDDPKDKIFAPFGAGPQTSSNVEIVTLRPLEASLFSNRTLIIRVCFPGGKFLTSHLKRNDWPIGGVAGS